MKYWLAILAVFLASPVLAIEEFSSAVFHAGSIADGDGQTRPVTHYGTLGIDIDITGTATVTIQGRSTLGEGFKSVRCVNTADGTVASAFTADANVQCPVSGLAEIKAPISGCSGCTVRVNGRLTTATISGLASLSVAGADGAVLDGVSSAIKATVRDYTNSNPLAVVMTDTNGDPLTSSSFDGILRDGSGDTTQANVTSGRLHVDGSGVTQPVSGTVTVTDGAGSLNVIVDSSALPSGASTLAEQQTQTTSLQLLDDTVATTAAAIPSKGLAASGTDGTNARVLKTDTNGELQVDVLTMPTVTVTDGAGALNVIVDSSALPSGASTLAEQQTQTTSLQLLDDAVATTAAAIPAKGFAASGTDGTNARVLKTDTAGELQVDVLTIPTVTVTDGAGALNVIVDSGSITANAGTNLNTSLLALESGGNLATIAGVVDATGTTVPANALVVGGTDGTNTRMLKTDTAGELQVDVLTLPSLPTGSNVIGALTANQSVNVAQMNSTAITMGNGISGTGVQRVTIASDSTGQVAVASLPNEGTQTAANSVSVTIASDIASGATTIPTAAAQGLVVRQPAACTSYVPISQTADTAVITATASQYIYICSIVLVAGAAETVSIWEGTGTACATGSAAIFGSTTEANGMALAANGGFSSVSGQPFVRTASVNVDLCIRQVGTNRVSGMISYIKAP